MPWQQYAADVACEVDENGDLFYEEVVITVPRQSGKTTLILAVLVWRCVVMAGVLGSQTVTYLAQSGVMARRKLEREFAKLLRAARSLREIPQSSRRRPSGLNEWKLSMNNGSEHIAFGTGSFLQIEAPTGKGGHGDVLDTSVIDEAFAREDDLVEQAVDAATVTRRSPQSFIVSTAGNERSTFLWGKVRGGRRACKAGTPGRTCYLEWSVPLEEPHDDPEVWARYLPALGHTITVARLQSRLDKAMRNPDHVDQEGDDVGLDGWCRAYLNQWRKVPPDLMEAAAVIDVNGKMWTGAENPEARMVSHMCWALSVSPDQKWSTFGVAGRLADGRPHVEFRDREAGTHWVVAKAVESFAANGGIPLRIHTGGVEGMFVDPLREAGVIVEEVSTADVARATGQFIMWANAGELSHPGQAALNIAIKGAALTQSAHGAALWSQRASNTEITPLLACTVALGGVPAPADEEGDVNLW
jgi:hypothetical protein